jgi:hypothetical protein
LQLLEVVWEGVMKLFWVAPGVAPGVSGNFSTSNRSIRTVEAAHISFIPP